MRIKKLLFQSGVGHWSSFAGIFFTVTTWNWLLLQALPLSLWGATRSGVFSGEQWLINCSLCLWWSLILQGPWFAAGKHASWTGAAMWQFLSFFVFFFFFFLCFWVRFQLLGCTEAMKPFCNLGIWALCFNQGYHGSHIECLISRRSQFRMWHALPPAVA